MSTMEVTKAIALPETSDREAWTDDQAAAIEAAGLVFTYGDWPNPERNGEKVLAPRAIVAKFLHTAARTGLDPIARQLYCIPRLGKGGIEWAIQTAIDGFRVIAERSRQYAGQDAPEWLTADGQWVEVWIRELHGQRGGDGKVLADAHPLAARIRVYRHDWDDDKPAVGIATWDEYAQRTSKGALTAMWQQRGPGQLAKCAEALALRKGFPQDLSGLYTDDEMQHATVLQDLSGEPEEGPERPALKSRVPRAQRSQEPSGGSDGTATGSEADTAADQGVGLPGPDSEGVLDAEITESGWLLLEPCSRCGKEGRPTSDMGYHAQLCGECEAEVDAEIAEQLAAEQEGSE